MLPGFPIEHPGGIAVVPNVFSVNEGSNVTFSVEGLEPNTTYDYALSEVSGDITADDFSGGLTGTLTTDSNGDASKVISLTNDLTLKEGGDEEGTESFDFVVKEQGTGDEVARSESVTINDTSYVTPSLSNNIEFVTSVSLFGSFSASRQVVVEGVETGDHIFVLFEGYDSGTPATTWNFDKAVASLSEVGSFDETLGVYSTASSVIKDKLYRGTASETGDYTLTIDDVRSVRVLVMRGGAIGRKERAGKTTSAGTVNLSHSTTADNSWILNFGAVDYWNSPSGSLLGMLRTGSYVRDQSGDAYAGAYRRPIAGTSGIAFSGGDGNRVTFLIELVNS